MKILITGITGFVGSHLAEAYLKKGDEIFGTYRYHHLNDEFERIIEIKDRLKLFDCDLNDRASVFRVIEEVKPDIIHHLAAQSFVKQSFDNPEFTLTNNILGELNIFEVCRQLGSNPIIHIAGSSEEYGDLYADELPIKEDNPLRPMSPYAVSKVTQDMLAQQYHMSYGLKTVITRAFNHEGPKRGSQFVTSAFAIQVIKIIKGLSNEIKVGNTGSIRDYTDIHDMIEAYMLAVQKCDYGIPYNICSGKGHLIQEILDYYSLTYLSGKKYTIVQDKELMRSSDLPVLIGDFSKFKEKTGWSPTVSFQTMLDRILNYWLKKYETKS